MLKRTITGAFITAIVYAVLYFAQYPGVLLCATAVLVGFSIYELCHAAGYAGNEAFLTASLLCSLGLTVWNMPYYQQILQIVFLIALVGFALLMLLQKRCSLHHPAMLIMIEMIIVLLYKSFPVLHSTEYGNYYLTGAVTLCFATDVAAYLVGRSVGKHKLMPKVSPNKTVEGFLGGILSAVLFMLLMGLCLDSFYHLAIDYKKLTIYALLASVVGQFGDLAMSSVKRICGIKDFGNLFPGHGGMLDRFDSHLFAVAFTLIYCSETGGFIQ